ncbi:MAG: hypothetical protein QME96_08405, partial [Myxococcota bacterium]|nr:hypothetical protein [Myxococcota bacterium]
MFGTHSAQPMSLPRPRQLPDNATMPFDHDRRWAAARTAIGIDVGGTAMKGGLVGPGGAIERRGRAPTPAPEGEDAILDALERLARALRRGRR